MAPRVNHPVLVSWNCCRMGMDMADYTLTDISNDLGNCIICLQEAGNVTEGKMDNWKILGQDSLKFAVADCQQQLVSRSLPLSSAMSLLITNMDKDYSNINLPNSWKSLELFQNALGRVD